MRNAMFSFLILTLILGTSTAWAWKPNPNDKMELKVQEAITDILAKDDGMQHWFKTAAGYAVFPTVGKGGIGIGGAHGKGLVIAGDKVVGTTSLSQITIGLQLGGQAYSEFIFFRDKTALADFKRGNYEMDAQASAVAATAGASASADYNKGVAVFTNVKGGLMYEATIGGQKFKFTAK
ncbi:MAG TPA: YSC84-related protein [Verrucomicrobiae bacterium]|nr:YSC84-related protein [Verrucomicrobiae bacterium]